MNIRNWSENDYSYTELSSSASEKGFFLECTTSNEARQRFEVEREEAIQLMNELMSHFDLEVKTVEKQVVV